MMPFSLKKFISDWLKFLRSSFWKKMLTLFFDTYQIGIKIEGVADLEGDDVFGMEIDRCCRCR